MASVLLLLPDEMLAEIDAIRPDGPRLEWIREALSSKLTMDRNQARVREAQAEAVARAAQRRSTLFSAGYYFLGVLTAASLLS